MFLNGTVSNKNGAMFQEPRLLRAKEMEGSWWRVIDVPKALEARVCESPACLRPACPILSHPAMAGWLTKSGNACGAPLVLLLLLLLLLLFLPGRAVRRPLLYEQARGWAVPDGRSGR